MNADLNKLPDSSAAGFTRPGALSDLSQAVIKIVPGVPSIEILPPSAQSDDSFRFAGPLLVEDLYVRHPGEFDALAARQQVDENSALTRFFEANRGRKIVYVTLERSSRPEAASALKTTASY